MKNPWINEIMNENFFIYKLIIHTSLLMTLWVGYTRFIDDTLRHSDIAKRVARTADYYVSPVLETISGIGQCMGGQLEYVNGPYDRGSGIVAG